MPAKSATLKDLQRQCTTAGLDATGTKADLSKRLEENKRNRVLLSPESQEDTKCDAILVASSELGGDEAMKEDAKDALQQALKTDELHVEDVRGELFVGNRRGLNLAGLPKLVHELQDEIASQNSRITIFEFKVASLEERVNSLTNSLEAYSILRNRFISTFKRDKLGNATETDRNIIAAGNASAHGGDAVVDASLYSNTGRREIVAYMQLYGIHPSVVLAISEFFAILKNAKANCSDHSQTINVLNTHAGIAASKYKTGSVKFYALFKEFVKLFEESGERFDVGYLDGNATDVTRAYWAFLNCIKDEVTRADVAED